MNKRRKNENFQIYLSHLDTGQAGEHSRPYGFTGSLQSA